MRPPVLITVLMLSSLALVIARPACAQTQRSGGESQKLMQQYQQLAAEKTSLQAQVAQQKKDLDAAKADLAAMQKQRDLLKAQAGVSVAAVGRAQSEKQAAEQTVEQSKQRTAELVTRYRELAQTLKETELDRNKARGELTARNAAYDTCAQNNMQLYEITGQVLDRYEHVGLFSKASAVEPFTRVTRTRIENLVDDYRTRAEELRVKKN
jgi:chromosome segregation ATPase